MASQEDYSQTQPATQQVETGTDYKKDQELFSKFLREHSILVVSNSNNDDDDDSVMLEPMAASTGHQQVVTRRNCYLPHLQRIRDRHFYEETSGRTFVVEVPLDELVEWNAGAGKDLADKCSQNTVRYVDIFCAAIDQALAGLQQANNNNNNNRSRQQQGLLRDPVDILQEQRLAQQEANQQQNNNNNNSNNNNPNNPYAAAGNLQGENGDDGNNNNNPNNNDNPGGATEAFPPALMRRYELRILPLGRRGTLPPYSNQYLSKSRTAAVTPLAATEGASLRNVRSRAMGRIVTIRGLIVRASDVKPACTVATYSCDACGAELYQVIENKREFLLQRLCPTQQCRVHKSKRQTIHLQTRGSKFVKFQELKLQELPNQVPMGHVPRSMSVYCRGELTRLAAPGDIVTIDGIFLPQRLAESGYQAMKAGLITTTYLEAQNIIIHKKSYDESLLDSLTDEESNKLQQEIMGVATGDDPIGKLSASLAPEIFGHEDIKRSLLLQLVGGCTRFLPDGMRIRGDINICLMGDPGVAKSQLLKHVASIAPRGVYTTGKGSSGVGLTAAVTKDMATGEMALEGGALVLADRGICAIDEFDKMDENDRTAIHEVMEQQTVSIAKAGIIATLNARAAVLAAANPLYGRYNRNKSLSENINLPNSLLSRFDLLFLVLDIADVDRDMALARHVTFVHQNEGLDEKKDKDDGDDNMSDFDDSNDPNEATAKDIISPRVLREYIARARQHHPVMPPDVAPYVVEAYVSLRMEDRPGTTKRRSGKQNDQTAMTPRQLLSILRLSQALARLRFSDFVAREDVDEAIRLTHMSKASLESDIGEDGKKKPGEDVMSRIYNIIRDYAASSDSKEVELKLCEAMVLRKGFTVQQLQACLQEYEALDVLEVNRNRTHVYLL